MKLCGYRPALWRVKRLSTIDTVSVFSLYCRSRLPQGEGGSILTNTDLKGIQRSSGEVGHFRKPTCLLASCINDICASFSTRSTSSTFPTYHLSSYTAATQSPATGTIPASAGHSFRRCIFQEPSKLCLFHIRCQ